MRRCSRLDRPPVAHPRYLCPEMAADYPCPCCGHLVFREPPGSYDICEAQSNYAEFGASERAHHVHVRPATDDDPLEAGWRPIDLERDSFEPEGKQDAPWPEDATVLYWWRPTFWRRDRRAAG